MNEDIILGRLMGRREAFAAVAGRCSAEDAELLRQMREEKMYLKHAPNWDTFCSAHLRVSRSSANRVIGWLNEFGPMYFVVAQLTKITPEVYRAIAPSIQDGKLRANGEVIALLPENADKVQAAVAELRKSTTPPRPDPVAEFEARCEQMLATAAELAEDKENVPAVRRAVVRAINQLGRLGSKVGLPLGVA